MWSFGQLQLCYHLLTILFTTATGGTKEENGANSRFMPTKIFL